MLPLSPRNMNRHRATPFSRRPKAMASMATPMLSHLTQLPASFKCNECGPVHFTLSINGVETCGDCGNQVIDIVATSKKVCPDTVKLTTLLTNDENTPVAPAVSLFSNDDDVTPSVLSKQATSVPSGIGSRRRRLFSGTKGSESKPVRVLNSNIKTSDPAATPLMESKHPDGVSVVLAAFSTDKKRKLFNATPSTSTSSLPAAMALITTPAPVDSLPTGIEQSPDGKQVRAGIKLEGRYLLVKACRPPMTNGFYRISVTDIGTGNESEFISCAKERSAFESWPNVDFVSLLSNHYDSSPKRAPFPYQGTPVQHAHQATTEEKYRHPSPRVTETQTATQSPLATTSIQQVIEQQSTCRPSRCPPPTPAATTPAATTPAATTTPATTATKESAAVKGTDTNANTARIAALEELVNKEQRERTDCEERLSIVIEHSEHRLSTLLVQKEEQEMKTTALQNEMTQCQTAMAAAHQHELEHLVSEHLEDTKERQHTNTLEKERHAMKINEMETILASKKVLVQQYKQQQEQVGGELTTTKMALADALQQRATLQQQVDKVEHASSNAFVESLETISTLQQQVSVLQQQLLDAQDAHEQVTSDTRTATMVANEGMKHTIALMNEEKSSLEHQLKDTSRKVDKLSMDLEISNHAAEQATARIKHVEETAAEAVQLAVAAAQVSTQQSVDKAVEAALQQAHTGHENERQQELEDLHLLNQETEQLKEELQTLSDQFETSETTIAAMKTEQVVLQASLDTKSNAIALANVSLQEKDNALATMKDLQQTTLCSLDESMKTVGALKEQLLALEASQQNSQASQESVAALADEKIALAKQQFSASLEVQMNAAQEEVVAANVAKADFEMQVRTIAMELSTALECKKNVEQELKQQNIKLQAMTETTELNSAKQLEYGVEQYAKGQEEMKQNMERAQENQLTLTNASNFQQEEETKLLQDNLAATLQKVDFLTKKVQNEKQLKDRESQLLINACDKLQAESNDKDVFINDIMEQLTLKDKEIQAGKTKDHKYVTLSKLVVQRNEEVKTKDKELLVLRTQKENWEHQKMEMEKTTKELTDASAVAVQNLEGASAEALKFEKTISDLEAKLKTTLKKTKKAEHTKTTMEEYVKEEIEKSQKALNSKIKECRDLNEKEKKMKEIRLKMKLKIKELTKELTTEKTDSKETNLRMKGQMVAAKNEAERCRLHATQLAEKAISEEKQILNLTSENVDLETKVSVMEEKVNANNANMAKMTEEKEFFVQSMGALIEEVEELRKKTNSTVDECETF